MQLWVAILIFFSLIALLLLITVLIIWFMYKRDSNSLDEPKYDSVLDYIDKKFYGGNDKNGV